MLIAIIFTPSLNVFVYILPRKAQKDFTF